MKIIFIILTLLGSTAAMLLIAITASAVLSAILPLPIFATLLILTAIFIGVVAGSAISFIVDKL